MRNYECKLLYFYIAPRCHGRRRINHDTAEAADEQAVSHRGPGFFYKTAGVK